MISQIPQPVRLYLDVCCLNRPFDDQSQPRIHLEAEAVLAIIGRVTSHGWRCLTSQALVFEIGRTPDPQRRRRVSTLLASATREPIIPNDTLLQARTDTLVSLGFRPLDALHIAGAERATADAFLTTDDRLLRLAARLHADDRPTVPIANPLAWLTARLATEEGDGDDAGAD